MQILNDVDNLIYTTEQEYFQPGQPLSFWDRHKGKILLGGGLLGMGLMANQGTLGQGMQNFVKSNAKMVGGGLRNLGNTIGGVAAPVQQAVTQTVQGPQLGLIARKVNDFKKGVNGVFGGL